MAPVAKFSGEHRPELQNPPPYSLVGDIQPALGEQILDITEAEREPDIEPNGVPDDRGRELMARKGNRRHSPSYPPGSNTPTVPVTSPFLRRFRFARCYAEC
jgi:hypothetical protein